MPIARNPDHADAHYNLGRVLVAQNRPDEASEHFRAATQLDPRYGELINSPEQP